MNFRNSTRAAPSRVPVAHGSPERGFTLLEMVIVITIIAVLAGSLLPVLTRPYVTERRLETVTEMGQIETGILGKPEYGDYGYIGSIGALPPIAGCSTAGTAASFVVPLITNSGSTTCGVPNVTLAPTCSGSPVCPVGIPTGWNGPYIRSEFQDPTQDAWGTQYCLFTNPTDPTQWALASAGPDHVFGPEVSTNPHCTPVSASGADDIVFPSQFSPGSTQQATYYYGSAGNVVLDIWDNYGTSQTAVPNGIVTIGVSPDIESVGIWHPDGSTPGSLVLEPCAPIPVGGPITGTTNQWDCGDPAVGGGHLIPFGLRQVQITFNTGAALCSASGKYGNYLTNNPACTFTQDIIIERRTTYAKIDIPVTPLVVAPSSIPTTISYSNFTAAAPFQFNGAAQSGTTQAPGNVTYLLAGVPHGLNFVPNLTMTAQGDELPAASQSTIVDATATVIVQTSGAATTTNCVLELVYSLSPTSTPGTWTNWGPFTTNLTMKPSPGNPAGGGGTAPVGTVNYTYLQGGGVPGFTPITIESMFPVPTSNQASFDIQIYPSSGANPCVATQAQLSLKQWRVSP